MKKGWAIGSFLGIIAICLLGFLIWKTKEVGHTAYNLNVGNLRHLQRLDASWTVEVMKSQLALSQNYDNLASYLPEIRVLRAKLQTSELADQSLSSGVIVTRLEKYLSTLAKKEDLIERFKSKHAIVRNSARYLPQAGEAVILAATANDMNGLASDIRLHLKDLYDYLMTPTALKRKALAKVLEIKVMDFPKDVANPASNFLSHANLILEQKEPTDAILASIVELSTAKEISILLDLYGQFHNLRVNAAQKYQIYLFVYAGILLLGSLLLARRLVQSYGSERENQALTEANRELESNVSSRTRELEDAYRKLKGSQAQLVHAGRMSTIGQLVAGVAHEVNTPLGYLRGNVETLNDFIGDFDELVSETEQLRHMLDNEEAGDERIASQLTTVNGLAQQLKGDDVAGDAKQLLTDMDYGIEQITLIVKSLKDFSRIDRAKHEKVDLRDVVENTLRVSQNMIKKHAEVVKQLEPIPQVTCSPSQINQVLLNLLTNSVHAIEKKGIHGIIQIRTKMSGSRWVCISVKDNGTGMDEAIGENIFEPFYTTKEAGKGTGLGLSICQNIMQEHGGHLRFKSIPGKGTIFQIALPLEAKNPKPPEVNS